MTDPYKRYMCFSHDTYYPGGGIGDCQCSFDTIEEALEWYRIAEATRDSAYVFDRIEGVMIT